MGGVDSGARGGMGAFEVEPVVGALVGFAHLLTGVGGLHLLLSQSESSKQISSPVQRRQGLRPPPPQSTSVSSPFLILSAHDATVGAAVVGDEVGEVVGEVVGEADGAKVGEEVIFVQIG